MSLPPPTIGPVPAETARVARAAFPHGNLYLRLRDELGPVYEDAAFAALYPARGRPVVPPWRLALILIFQFVEGLSDRQAADAVRGRLDWKYALGLELTDAGFDASVLSEFRTRLVTGGAEQRLLDVLLARCQAVGLLRARGRQRTDATHVLAAVRTLNRLECVGETVRHALNTLAQVAPAWLRGQLDPAWAERYGARVENYRLPKAAAAREALAAQMGADGYRLLAAVYAPTAPAWLREVPAVETLRQVWVQQYYAPTPTVRWRAAADQPPASQLLHSPYEPAARYGTKREHSWAGYKAHLTETCDPARPRLVTDAATTPATTPDGAVLGAIHARLAARALLPAEHLVDAGYVEAAHLVTSEQRYGIALVGPAPADTSWQARAAAGFATACFVVDWEQQTARCPQGQPSALWTRTRDRTGQELLTIRWPAAACRACASRPQCTSARAGPRTLTVRPREQYEALQAARQRQTTAAFRAQHAPRAGAEGTLSQAVRACDLRRSRYRGLAKTHLQHVLIAAALNLKRLGAWWAGHVPAQTRRAPFLDLFSPAS
jgi:transposase